MKKIFSTTLIIITVFLSFWAFVAFGTGKGYQEYQEKWEYRRLHPELIPSPILVRTFDMGHTTSYASWQWLNLIQYIGDNIGNNQFLSFSHTILEQITTLHPYFTRPYEIDLLFTPFSAGENMTPEQQAKTKIATTQALELGEKGLRTLCDNTKIEKIKSLKISETLWNNQELRNPCASGMLPYYMGFITYQRAEDKKKASEYYKIASMHDDAPTASRILSILALSVEGNHLASAMNFALIGSTGYDIEPYTCQDLANTISKNIVEKRVPNMSWVNELQTREKNLKNTQNKDNPISQSSNNCYDMATRSIREIYLGYITNIAHGTTAKNGNDLIKLGLLKDIPTLSTQKGFTVREKNGIWEYRTK